MNKQISLSVLNDEFLQVRTKKKEFLEQIERIVLWGELITPIKPCYQNTKINFMFALANLILADRHRLSA